MNDIIKNIEAAQLKEQAPEFRVGDTVKVYGKIKEGNRERIQILKELFLRDRVAVQERHLQLERHLMESALRRHGQFTHLT